MYPRPHTTSGYLDRRRFLSLCVATSCATAAGCLGPANGGGYERWLPATDGSMVMAYVDLSVAEESPDAERLLPVILPSGNTGADRSLSSISGLDEIGDPLVTTPLQIGGRIMGAASLSIAATGLGPLLFPEGSFQAVEELLLVDGVVIAELGDVEHATVREKIREGTDNPLGKIPFERTGELHDYAVYEPTPSDVDGVLTLGDSTIIFGDTREDVRTVLGARNDDQSRAVAHDETIDWLFENAGEGHFAVGWSGEFRAEEFYFGDPDEDLAGHPLVERETVLSSVRFAPENEAVVADVALSDPALSETDRDRLRSRLGSAGTDVSVSTDGNRLTMTGSYTQDVLDVEYSTVTETTESPPPEERYEGVGETPAVVDSAVPDRAFAFVYDDSEGTVRVRFLEEFAADEVTIIALESEGEVSTTSPGPTDYLTVPVDPNGDEVVVVVTVDGEAGEVARTTTVGNSTAS